MKLRSRLRGLSLCICLGSIFAQTAMPPITGAGTASEPYQIATLENLYWIGTTDSTVTPDLSSRLHAHYIQVADINASSTSTWNYDGAGTYEGWAPIGTGFSGYYDGGGHIIDSLYIYRPSQNYQSLFGFLYYAEIKNLGLMNVNITGNDNTGAICGYLRYTNIINCFVSGTLSGNNYTGGLLGYADGGIIDRCYNKASVLQGSGDAVGGLIGYNKSCTVGNCYNIGDVNGIYNVGGLVGYNRSGSVSKCYNSGTIFGQSSNSGALLGFNLGGVVSDSFWDIDSSGFTFIFFGTALNSAEMKNDSNFIDAGWDFVGESVNGEDDIWNIDSSINMGYPYLENHLLVIRDLTISGGGNIYHLTDHTPDISYYFYCGTDDSLYSYQIQVSSIPDFSIIDQWDTHTIIGDDTLVTYSGETLLDGQTYYLRIRGSNGDSLSQWTVRPFRMNSKPQSPLMISPENNSVLDSDIRFVIHTSTDNESDPCTYQFYLYNDSLTIDISEIESDTNWVSSTIFSENGRYWWNARAFDGFEFSDFLTNNIFYINAINSAPESFTLSYPLNDLTITSRTPEFSWHPAFDIDPGDSITYYLYLDTPDPGEIIYTVQSDTTLTLMDPLSDNTTYYWRVFARDLSGAEIENSEGYRQFTINTANNVPSKPLPLSPDSVIVLTLKPEFRWKAATDPDPDDGVHYKLYVWNETFGDSSETDSTEYILHDPIEDNREYSWYVKAIDNYLAYSSSKTVKFWTDLFPEPTTPFNTVSPANGEVLESTIVDLLWNSSKDPDPLDYATYTLKYKSTHQDSTIWHEVEVGTDTTYSINLTLGNRYEWQIIAKDDDGFEVISDSSNLHTFDVGDVTGIAFLDIPQEFTLNQNYPNPFNPATRLRYGLPETSDIRLIIFDLMGRKVKEWDIISQQPGWHEVIWNGTNQSGQHVSTGVYIYSLRAGNFVDTKKMVFMK